MASFLPIPTGGDQGPVQTISASSGTQPVKPGILTIFLGASLTGNLTLALPSARLYPAGRAIEIIDAFGASGSFGVLVAATGSDLVNAGTSAVITLSGTGRAEVYSDGVGKWNLGAGVLVGTGAGTLAAGNDSRLPLIAVDVSQPGNANYMAGALQAALNAVPSGGARIYLRNGSYQFGNATFGCNNPAMLIGDGMGSLSDTTGAGAAVDAGYVPGGTALYTSSGGDFITFQSSGSTVRDCALVNTAGTPLAGQTSVSNPPTSGTGINFYHCTDAQMSRVLLVGFWNGIHYVNGYGWAMAQCKIGYCYNFGVLDEDVAVPDGGDPSIVGCTFVGLPNVGSAIAVRSGGGLKLSASKINGWSNGVNLQAALATSDLIATGNSIENCGNTGFLLSNVAGNATFENVLISGNQFAALPNCIQITSDGIHDVVITGNLLRCGGTAINIGGGSQIHVLPNTFYAPTSLIVTGNASEVHVTKQTAVGPMVIYDQTAGGNRTPAMIAYGETQSLPAGIGASFVTIASFTLPTYAGCRVTLTVEGILNGTGGFLFCLQRAIERETGNANVTVIGTDIATGAGAANMSLAITDTGNGVMVVQIKSTTGGEIKGTSTVEAQGALAAYTH